MKLIIEKSTVDKLRGLIMRMVNGIFGNTVIEILEETKALASVVDEPVLTEEEIDIVVAHWWNTAILGPDEYRQDLRNLRIAILNAGRIPASKSVCPECGGSGHVAFGANLCPGCQGNRKPTPQQEDGLTREWLAQYIKQDPDVITGILTRHAQASEGGWISVKEREPDNNARVLACTTMRTRIVASFYNGHWFDEQSGERDVSYWQPLPPPPQPDKDLPK